MTAKIRLTNPDPLRKIKICLQKKHGKQGPTMQDIVDVALYRFICDWEDPCKKEQLRIQLLGSRAMSLARMGKKK
ncbi:MAG: hypothetical protein ACRC2R_17870 [Xenococcaceae cyanobacterium]